MKETKLSQEVLEAEGMMSPPQRLMTKARDNIMSRQQELLAVGITPQQIESVANKAGERARIEFEAEEGDTLQKIAVVLLRVTETADEYLLAETGIARLENFRSAWADIINNERVKLGLVGKPELCILKKIVKDAHEREIAPGYVAVRSYGTGQPFEHRPGVAIVDSLVIDEGNGESNRILPSASFKERILRGLGVLEADQSLESLKDLPRWRRGYREPIFCDGSKGDKNGYADRLPTLFPGIEVRVGPTWPAIYITMNLETFRDIL